MAWNQDKHKQPKLVENTTTSTELVDGIKQILLTAHKTYEHFPYDSTYRPYYIAELDYLGVQASDDDTYLSAIKQDFENNGTESSKEDASSSLFSSTQFYENYLASKVTKNFAQRQEFVPFARKECAFCKNNGKDPASYKNHFIKDLKGRVTCPVLRAYICPICSATGDDAHTFKYCPSKNQPDISDFDTGSNGLCRIGSLQSINSYNSNYMQSNRIASSEFGNEEFEDFNNNYYPDPYNLDTGSSNN